MWLSKLGACPRAATNVAVQSVRAVCSESPNVTVCIGQELGRASDRLEWRILRRRRSKRVFQRFVQSVGVHIGLERGSPPTAVSQTRYEWVHLFAAVEPTTDASSTLLSPEMNAGVMNVFLKQLVREELTPEEHAVAIMDQAGWHTSNDLEVLEEMTILR